MSNHWTCTQTFLRWSDLPSWETLLCFYDQWVFLLSVCLSIARSCLQYLINMAATQKFAILTQTFLPLTISLFSSAFFSKCQLKTFWVFTTRVGVHVNVSSMIFHYHTFFCISKFNAIDKTVTFSGFKMAEHAYYVRKEVFVNVITIKQQPFTPNMKKEKKEKDQFHLPLMWAETELGNQP